MNFISDEAIVIDLIDTGEKDIRVSFLTANQGKIRATAKGASSIKSQNRNNLQLGNILKISLNQRFGHYYLIETSNLQSFLLDRKKLLQYNLLFFILEVIKEVIPDEDPSSIIYQDTKTLLNDLNLNHFASFINHQLILLKHLGFGTPDLSEKIRSKQFFLAQKDIISYFEKIISKPLKSSLLLK